jgi:hypothetical protein
MYPVTQDFQTQIKAMPRQVYGKVAIDYTDPFIDQSLQASANEQANVSYPAQTADAVVAATHKWASLDGAWALDGSVYLAPGSSDIEDNQFGWWGSSLAGAGGGFAVPYPKLTVAFFSRPVHSLKVVGDSARGEYPVDFEIILYGTGDVVKHTQTVTGNTAVTWSVDITPVLEVVKMTLEISKWSREGRQVKILEFFTSIQEIYEGVDVLNINLLEEREVSQGSLPIGNISANEVNVSLSNITRKFDAGNTQSPLYQLVKQNRRIRAWLGVEVSGSVEYVPLGVFWSGDWEVPENSVYAKTTGWDRLELLRKSTYSSSQVAIDTTLYDLAVAVLDDAGLEATEYWVDTELQDYPVPYAWFEPISHREALRLIAEACLGQVYCDRDGVVRIEGPSFLVSKITSVLTITQSDYFNMDSPVKWSEITNYVEVDTQSLRPATIAEEVYRSNESVSIGAGETKILTVYYNKTPCIEAVASLEGAPSGASITAVAYYGWGAEVSVNSPNAGTFSLVINAKPLSAQNKERAIAQDADSITDNGKLRYSFPSNPLVQTLAVAQTIANTLLAAFKNPRRDIELRWRGNPALQLADRITAPDSKTTSADFHVTSQTLEFDGALQSTIRGRRAG